MNWGPLFTLKLLAVDMQPEEWQASFPSHITNGSGAGTVSYLIRAMSTLWAERTAACPTRIEVKNSWIFNSYFPYMFSWLGA
jgi:hypothetical protein